MTRGEGDSIFVNDALILQESVTHLVPPLMRKGSLSLIQYEICGLLPSFLTVVRFKKNFKYYIPISSKYTFRRVVNISICVPIALVMLRMAI